MPHNRAMALAGDRRRDQVRADRGALPYRQRETMVGM